MYPLLLKKSNASFISAKTFAAVWVTKTEGGRVADSELYAFL